MNNRKHDPSPSEDAGARILRLVNRLRTGYRRTGLAVAVLLFVAGGIAAASSIELATSQINWWLLSAVAVVGVPPMIALNGAEVRAAAAGGDGAFISWRDALVVAVAGTAANLLPIPGAALVRIEALTASGATGKSAVRATLAIGTVWISVSSLVAGFLLLGSDNGIAGGIALVLAVTAVLGTLALTSMRERSARWLLGVASIESLALAVTTVRLWAIATAIGVDVTLPVAGVMSVSYAFSAAIGFFPGGLGIREAMSSGLGRLAGAAGSTGFILSAIDRFVGLAVHLLVGATLLLRRAGNGR